MQFVFVFFATVRNLIISIVGHLQLIKENLMLDSISFWIKRFEQPFLRKNAEM